VKNDEANFWWEGERELRSPGNEYLLDGHLSCGGWIFGFSLLDNRAFEEPVRHILTACENMLRCESERRCGFEGQYQHPFGSRCKNSGQSMTGHGWKRESEALLRVVRTLHPPSAAPGGKGT